MPTLAPTREQWRDVSPLSLEALLRGYPRPLETRPPLTRKANYREWVDPAFGQLARERGGEVLEAWGVATRTRSD